MGAKIGRSRAQIDRIRQSPRQKPHGLMWRNPEYFTPNPSLQQHK
jgi:hypothetical protein